VHSGHAVCTSGRSESLGSTGFHSHRHSHGTVGSERGPHTRGLCTRTRRSTGWFDRRVGVVSEELMQLRGRGGSRGAFSAGCRLRRV
jgi:hypothetical protein